LYCAKALRGACFSARKVQCFALLVPVARERAAVSYYLSTMLKIRIVPALLVAACALICGVAALVEPDWASGQECSMAAKSPESAKILATMNSVQIDTHLQFLVFYLLRNQTQDEIDIPESSGAVLLLRSRKKKEPLQPVTQQDFKLIYPIILHPGQRQVIMIRDARDKYPELGILKLNADHAEYMRYEKKVEAYVDRQWPDFGGFVFCDPHDQVRIDLPRGWK
jgi:hypothetical protein